MDLKKLFTATPRNLYVLHPILRSQWLEDYGYRVRPGQEYVGVLSVHHGATGMT